MKSVNEHGRLFVDVDALLENYLNFASVSANETGAVVKADAYGIGAAHVAPLLANAGNKHFFTGTLQEALAIRSLVDGEIYSLTGLVDENSIAIMREQDITPVLYSARHLALWSNSGVGSAALHVDTGMQRLGISTQELLGLDCSRVEISLLMTHLACADQPEHELNELQIQRFHEVAERFPNTKTSIGNSAGILNGKKFQGDVTRPGIGLYGGNPYPQLPNPMKMVCTLEGRVLQKRVVRKGESIGYGASYVATKDLDVAVVGLGYADGIARSLSDKGYFAYGEKLLPILGRVCMDLVNIDASEARGLKTGDFVEFFGPTIALDEVAAMTSTISYEVLTTTTRRVLKHYV